MKISTQTRRQLLQSTSAVALAAILPSLPGCATVKKRPGQGQSPNPTLITDIPLSDYAFATTADEVAAGYDLSGMTVLITGCNSGLGYETMRVLALRGAHVFGAGRTLQKAADACASVTGKTTPVVIELSDFESVAAYQQWLEQAIVAKLNRRVSLLVEVERAHLRTLPVPPHP